jgi:hypothetical protein
VRFLLRKLRQLGAWVDRSVKEAEPLPPQFKVELIINDPQWPASAGYAEYVRQEQPSTK